MSDWSFSRCSAKCSKCSKQCDKQQSSSRRECRIGTSCSVSHSVVQRSIHSSPATGFRQPCQPPEHEASSCRPGTTQERVNNFGTCLQRRLLACMRTTASEIVFRRDWCRGAEAPQMCECVRHLSNTLFGTLPCLTMTVSALSTGSKTPSGTVVSESMVRMLKRASNHPNPISPRLRPRCPRSAPPKMAGTRREAETHCDRGQSRHNGARSFDAAATVLKQVP